MTGPCPSCDTVDEDACSFCNEPRCKVRVLVKGIAGCICDACCARASQPRNGLLAHCSSCTPIEGEHAPTCPEESKGA